MLVKKSRVRRHIAWFMSIMLILATAMIGRIAWIQFVNGEKLLAKARNQLGDYKEIQTPRGTIYDRNGRELAVSLMAKSLYASPDEINQDPQWIADLLAPVLKMPVEAIKSRLMTGGSFIWIKRTLDIELAEKVQKIIQENRVRGLHFLEESKRYYPNDYLAAHVLGFVGTDDVGLNGIETTLDRQIKGKLIRRRIDTDSYGMPIFDSVFSFSQNSQSKSVYLTIDSTIQFIVEKSLEQAMAATKAQAGTIIVMNPKTGEILAMACRPNYNPNEFYNFQPQSWKNRAVSVLYEPGSTFKTVVAAAALQEGVVTPQEKFIDRGYVEVSGRKIQNWSRESYGSISFEDIIKQSINTGFVQIGLKLGAARMNRYAELFGFGQVTDIELPGEESGILFKTEKMRDSDVATMAIGQSIAVTPLQLLTAVSAIANDGVLMRPYIIKEIANSDGKPGSVTSPQPVRQVITKETAETLIHLLEKVINQGGGKKAKVEGYHFAGKTGTAQKASSTDAGYQAGKYIASFVGFGPTDNPQLAALIVLDSPRGTYYGGQIAAPVFRQVMTQVVRYLNIPPNSNTWKVPSITVKTEIKRTNTKINIKPGKGQVIVPDVKGLTMREVSAILTERGLSFVPKGSGVAIKQSLLANTIAEQGTEIIVIFKQL